MFRYPNISFGTIFTGLRCCDFEKKITQHFWERKEQGAAHTTESAYYCVITLCMHVCLGIWQEKKMHQQLIPAIKEFNYLEKKNQNMENPELYLSTSTYTPKILGDKLNIMIRRSVG